MMEVKESVVSILRRSLSILSLFFLSLLFSAYKPVGSVDKKHKSLSEKTKLFQGLNCAYTNKMYIQYPHFLKLKPEESDFYKWDQVRLDEISQKYSGAIQLQKNAPMYLKWISDIVGYGIYAGKDIKAGDFIGEYVGELRVVKNESDNLDYAWYYTLDGLNGKKLVVDGKNHSNELRFINHASNPNTERVDVLGHDGVFHLAYIAKKDIKKDQQLTVNYGEGYWSSRGIKPQNFS